MRFHDERDKRLHPIRQPPLDAPPPGNEKFSTRRRGLLAQRPIKRSRHCEFLLHHDGITEDSLMITVGYEAHVAMQNMLAAFAEMRGDDADAPIG